MLERISRQERFDLLVAWGAISLAFTIIKFAPNGILGKIIPTPPVNALIIFGISLVTVGIAFVLHEMAHKFTAMKYGYSAQFHKNNTMLLVMMSLAALVGMIFAVPGATYIYTNSVYGQGLSRGQNGKISAAGPMINLLLCIPFAAILIISGGFTAVMSNNYLAQIGIAGVQINAMIAAFNLLPISILDGRKVWAWNKFIFAVLIIASFGTLVGSFYFL